MSDNKSSNGTCGCSFGSLPVGLTILFVGLKLTGYIDWSWWWFVSPLWIELVLMVVVLAVLGVIYWFVKDGY